MYISPDPSRFEKLDLEKCYSSSKYRNWPCDWPKVDLMNRDATFLSKIWAHYGPPNEVNYEGFDYCFYDNVTGSVFSAYSAGSGAAFGGQHENWSAEEKVNATDPTTKKKFQEAIEAFEKLLENTTPIDCAIEFETDFGLYRIGAREGIPFEEEIKPSS